MKALEEENISYHIHRVPDTSWGTILTSVWTSAGIVLAMPTYEYKMFPPMAAILDEMGKKKVQNRKAFRMGSYGWSGGAQRELDEIVSKNHMNWDFLEPVEFRGNASEEELKQIENRVHELAREVRAQV